MSDTNTPTIDTIKRSAGIAGQFSITATGTIEGEPYTLTFTGSVYGSPGPVVMTTGTIETFVSEPSRFGAVFNEAWVRAFITNS